MRPRPLHVGPFPHWKHAGNDHSLFQLLGPDNHYSAALVEMVNGRVQRVLTVSALEPHKKSIVRLAKKHLARSTKQ